MRSGFLFLFLVSLHTTYAYAQDYPALRKKLEDVNRLDQHYRIIIDSLVRKEKKEWNDPAIQELIPLASKQDSLNMIAVLDIVDRYGWLGVNKVGAKANETIFLIVQHADSVIMQKYFPLLAKSYELGESPGKFYAMMLDRILTDKGQKQIFGTQIQMRKENGEFVLFPIEDESNVDALRKKVGLKSLAEFRKSLRD
jgi:hypothetical protein